jgi:uncharacterized repeat protein (TIGR01451 family)
VTPATPAITTHASAGVAAGGMIADAATLSATVNGTETITYTLFGPSNPTCTGTPIFTSTKTVAGNGVYTSGSFVTSSVGTYGFVAVYSGDANNNAATSPCGAPNESVVVTPTAPTIVTKASAGVAAGGPITDTATLSAGANPSGTITFTAFGPNDAICATAAAFTSIKSVNANRDYVSDPFTATLAGTYRFVAAYSGDANNAATTTACNDPNESVVVDPATDPMIGVTETPNPVSLPQPGGTFTFTVTVTNTGTVPVTITALTNNVYGDLATRPGSTCGSLIGITLAPGATAPACTYTATFTGVGGASQSDIVTVTGRGGTRAVSVASNATAIVRITALPSTGPLAFTGFNGHRLLAVASGMVLVGLMLLLGSWRRRRSS